jgi:Ca-activated chloride channel family protein
MSFSLTHPYALALLAALPFLAYYQWRWGPKARARMRFSLSLAPTAKGPDREGILSHLRLASLALLIVAAAGPRRGTTREETPTPTTDIMLVLDTSSSMEALDFKPKNRVEGAKEVMRTFIEHRPLDRIGLVVFAGMAFTQCPLTLDHAALLEFLDKVAVGIVPEDRTAIGSALAVATARLRKSEAKSKTIILLTDGRNNAGVVDPVTAAKAAATLGVKIYAVGAGKPGGAEYPVDDPVFGRRIVILPEDLDETALRAVADAGGGRYFRATSLEGLKNIYDEIDRMEKTDVKAEIISDYRDASFPWILAGFLVFLTEILLTHAAFRRIP